MSSFRQLMMRKKGGGEKSGYLETSGGAYINLAGISIFSYYSFSCTFQIPNLDTAVSGDLGFVFGYRRGTSGNFYGFEIYGDGYAPSGIYGRFGSAYFSLSLTPKTDKHTFERTSCGQSLSNSDTIWLFARNDGSSGRMSNLLVRFWGLSFSNAGEKVIDLVPAIENGQAGVKDLISGNFYGKSGSGTITFVEE